MNGKMNGNKYIAAKEPQSLNAALERRMMLYALAAGAAGICAAPAQAKVVFTPSSAVVHLDHPVHIDLNNDGTVDFNLSVEQSTRCEHSSTCYLFASFLRADGQGRSDLIRKVSTSFASALPTNTKVSSNGHFSQYTLMVSNRLGSYGPFKNVMNRFLGVRFVISGETHYGWIGFSRVKGLTATLLGWAYETNPDEPIFTGFAVEFAQSGAGQVWAHSPTALGLLAQGHDAVADWRRRSAGIVANSNG